MRSIVAIAILVLVLLLGGLILYIVTRRGVSGVMFRLRQRRTEKLNGMLDRWLAGSTGVTGQQAPRLIFPGDRRLLAELCLQRLPEAPEPGRALLIDLLRQLRAISRWQQELHSRSTWRRAHAVERLGLLRSHDSIDALVAALDDEEFDVRMRAAKALGSLGGRKALTALVGALADDNRWSVIRIADLLAELGPEVAAELVGQFDRLPRSSRLAAIDLIARVGDASYASFLSGLLDDLDRDVRARAAAGLARLGGHESSAPLVAALRDVEWPVRAMAAKSLGEIGSIEAATALANALRDREWWVRCNAAEALGKLGSHGCDRLQALLDDQDRFARDQALAVLESTGELGRRLAPLSSPADPGHQQARALLEVLAARFSDDRLRVVRDRQTSDVVRQAIGRVLRSAASNAGEAS